MNIISEGRELSRLGQNLEDYSLLSGKALSEVLNQKGNDLRIQLFRGFWNQRLSDRGPRRGVAFRELARRARAKIGTLVRLMTLDDKWTRDMPDRTRVGHPLTLWQKLIYQEAQRRDAGVGILGVSFLSKRFRERLKRDTAGKLLRDASGDTINERYVASNISKTLGELVTITKEKDSFTIRGMTPSMNEISERYNIKPKAIAAVSQDMEIYLRRKWSEVGRSAFK